MAEFWTEKRVVISSDPTSLAESVAARFLSRVAKRTADGELAHIALTGGSMGAAVLAAAARHPRRERIDWSLVHFWWSDERFVPLGHADRNDRQAREALLDSLDIPAENILTVAASAAASGWTTTSRSMLMRPPCSCPHLAHASTLARPFFSTSP